MFVLLVDYKPPGEYTDEPPEVHGPFDNTMEALVYAENYREDIAELQEKNLISVSAANNEAWTELGWYFGIFPPKKLGHLCTS